VDRDPGPHRERHGTGTLTIQNGGWVTSNIGFIEGWAGGSATVLVADPGSQWTVNQDLGVGYSGTSTLTIQNGGQVTSNTGAIGGGNGGSATVLVADPGSQ